jgi:hypothetical protein
MTVTFEIYHIKHMYRLDNEFVVEQSAEGKKLSEEILRKWIWNKYKAWAELAGLEYNHKTQTRIYTLIKT